MTDLNATEPVDWTTIENELHTLAVDATGIEWFQANQASPQQPYPYGTITVTLGPDEIGLGEDRAANLAGTDDSELSTIDMVEFTIQFQINQGGDPKQVAMIRPDCSARAYATRLKARLGRATDLISLHTKANIAVIERATVTSFDLEIGRKWVMRSQFDVRFRATSVITETVKTLRQIRLTGVITGDDRDPTNELIPDPPPF